MFFVSSLIIQDSLQKDFGMKTGEMLWSHSRGIDNRLVGVIQVWKRTYLGDQLLTFYIYVSYDPVLFPTLLFCIEFPTPVLREQFLF